METAEIMAKLKKVPWWGWAGGGGAALGVGYYLYKRHASASASSSSQQQQSPAQQVSGEPLPAGLNMADLAGIPFDYQDYDAEYAGDQSGNPGDTVTSPPPAGPFPEPGQGISLPGTIGAPVSALANGSNINVPPAAPFPLQPPSSPIGSPPVPVPPAAPLPAPVAPAQPSVPGAAPLPEYVFEFHAAS